VVVARRHDDIRGGIAKLDPPQGEGDRSGGPATLRLDERDRRVRAPQLRARPGEVPAPDHDHRPLRRHDRREAPQRVLQHRAASADHRELLRIPPDQQHRVLFWGIFSALAMRAGFIFAGVALLERFHWLMYVFGAVLLVAAVRIGRPDGDCERERGGLVVRAVGRLLPTTATLHGRNFLIRDPATHRLVVTPLLVCLIALELTDIAFAIDSIPAVFGVTTDPFIVFTSNAMAILGLRSLYLAIAGGLSRFCHLQTGLAVILGFIGVKMLAHDVLCIPSIASLGVILAILGITAAWSWRDR
jgi:tellurite resistance protein TerC